MERNREDVIVDVNKTMLSGEAMALQFNKNLLNNSGALDYVLSRGIKMHQIESGAVGFCPPYSSHWFPLLKGRITVPIRDVHGRVIAFAGRQYEGMQSLTENALWEKYGDKPAKAEERIKKWQKSKWINETYPKNRHLYGLYEARNFVREMGYIVLVEGYFDVLVQSSRHLPNTAALCGVALSEYHCALISRYTQNVVLILDGDDAGHKALGKMMPKIEEADLQPYIVKLPNGYDPDNFVIKYGGKNLKRICDKLITDQHKKIQINFRY